MNHQEKLYLSVGITFCMFAVLYLLAGYIYYKVKKIGEFKSYFEFSEDYVLLHISKVIIILSLLVSLIYFIAANIFILL